TTSLTGSPHELIGAQAALAAWMDFQTRCGVAGISIDRTPRCATASPTAVMPAGVEAIDPDSPTPLAPKAFTGDGVVVWPRVHSVRSSARGLRDSLIAAETNVPESS